MTLIERIEELCEPEPNSGCWLFTGRLSPKGYPLISHDGRDRRAHRVMCGHKQGAPLPREIQACHSCDVRACCNPDHLFPGTNLDNVRDKVAKGRQARVAPVRRLKCRDQAEAVRSVRAKGATVHELSLLTGTSERQIERICAGTRWP